MVVKNVKIILDSNIWVSFAIGKRLNVVKDILHNTKIEVFSCKEIIAEVNSVLNRPKILKYIDIDRIVEVNEIISLSTSIENYQFHYSISRDPKDNYLLSLSEKVGADYLVTGDNDLLVLKTFKNTQIVDFNMFLQKIDLVK